MKDILTGMIANYKSVEELVYWQRGQKPASNALHVKRNLAKGTLPKALILSKEFSPVGPPSYLQVLEFCIQNEGYETFSAQDMQGAVDVLSSSKIELIVVDFEDFKNFTPGILSILDQIISNFGLNGLTDKTPVLALSKGEVIRSGVHAYSEFKGAIRKSSGVDEIQKILRGALSGVTGSTTTTRKDDRHSPGPQPSL